MKTRHILTVLLLALVSATQAQAAEDILPRHPQAMDLYLIGPSDVISVLVWNNEEMNRTVTVRPDGMVSLPLVGEIIAAGKTAQDLQAAVANMLIEYINIEPGEVSVVIDEVHSYRVSVLGEVNEPGRFEFLSRATVLDALAEAGGLTEFADSNDILILRHNGYSTERIRFNYPRMVKADNGIGPMLVMPGDIILVP